MGQAEQQDGDSPRQPTGLGSLLRGLRPPIAPGWTPTPLPESALCPECHRWDVTVHEVHAELMGRDPTGKLLAMAACICEIRRAGELQAIADLRVQANLPHPHSPRTFASFWPRLGTEEAVSAAREFAQRMGPPTLLLAGGTGAGKSHLLEAIGRDLLDQRVSVRYETGVDLLDRFRHTYSAERNEADIDDLMARYDRVSVMLLDDLGTEHATDWAVERLTSIVDRRMRRGLQTAVATNLTRDLMAERLGDRIASRLWAGNHDLGEVRVVTLLAGDYRDG